MSGFCSITLLHENLFRTSYHLAIVGPLIEMTDIYVVVIARTLVREIMTLVSGNGIRRTPDKCMTVTGDVKPLSFIKEDISFVINKVSF